MNKIEKVIIEIISETVSPINNSLTIANNETVEFSLPMTKVMNKIGVSEDQVSGILNRFLEEKYLIKVDKSGDNEWAISAVYSKLIELYNKSLEGLKLNSHQIRVRRRMEDKLKDIQRQDHYSQVNENLERQFNDGKWLRLCCASCGDFIQEITSYQELRELEDNVVECPRKHHQNRFKQVGEMIIFNSENTKILEILKEKKVDK